MPQQDIMNSMTIPGISKMTEETVYFRPAISIITPFEPKMTPKRELTNILNLTAAEVEQKLLENYPDELAMLMMQKLYVLFSNLNFSTHKKSIAIYLSPVFDKVLYLDIPVEQKIMVDESFEIRDIVYSKKQNLKYLVLLLSTKEMRMYLGDSSTFVKIVSDFCYPAHDNANKFPEQASNSSDIPERNKIALDEFLHHIDNTVGIMLNAYHLPLFILGTENILDHFRNLTKHSAAVIEYVKVSDENPTLDQLTQILEPHIADWKLVTQKDLLNQLKDAAGKSKLAVGMKDIWREAMKRNGRLLVMEKNYTYVSRHAGVDNIIYKAVNPYSKFSYVKDAIGNIIEKVLENSGDVEFVDIGLLKNYDHIALVQYDK